jgi:EAL domain-containing protein (putative c-di-GMP-specific phosphodiesterase class I)
LLGNQLVTTVLGEGIEILSQSERFRDPSCELGQGFFLSATVLAAEVVAMLDHFPGND